TSTRIMFRSGLGCYPSGWNFRKRQGSGATTASLLITPIKPPCARLHQKRRRAWADRQPRRNLLGALFRFAAGRRARVVSGNDRRSRNRLRRNAAFSDCCDGHARGAKLLEKLTDITRQLLILFEQLPDLNLQDGLEILIFRGF